MMLYFKYKMFIMSRYLWKYKLRLHIKIGKYTTSGKIKMKGNGKITIGNYTCTGDNVTIISTNHYTKSPMLHSQLVKYVCDKDILINEPVVIGNNVWIGDNVTILPGAKIGDHTIIGAGSVVTKEIPSNCVAVGVPCKVVKQPRVRPELLSNIFDESPYFIKKFWEG